jgi:hypothetical protein
MSMQAFEKLDRRVFGFMAVGFLSLIGGIFIFAFIVVPQRQPQSGVPRDVQMVFTQVFVHQNLLRNETGRFSPALIQLGVGQEECRRYNCLLTLGGDAQDYEFRLSKGDQTWLIRSNSPVPEQLGPEG